MLQISLLLMKSLNKTETHIFLSVVCSLFPKAIVLSFIFVRLFDLRLFGSLIKISKAIIYLIFFKKR